MSDALEMQDQPFVSVVIPVYNDAARLKLCLEALEEQTYPKNRYEVVVVDNGSSENIACVCKRFSQASYNHEAMPGSYAARNKGIEVARGDILAFTDADCIAQRDWLEKGVAKLISVPNCGLVGGRINLFFRDAHHPTAVELYENMFVFDQKKFIKVSKYSATANLFTFRRVFAEVGLFDGNKKSGEDGNWGKRVFSAGYELVYADDVVIAHPARFSLAEFIQREVRLAGGHYHKLIERDGSLVYFSRKAVKILVQRRIFKKIFRAEDLSVEQKLEVAGVAVVQRLVHVFELVRLRLGGEAHR